MKPLTVDQVRFPVTLGFKLKALLGILAGLATAVSGCSSAPDSASLPRKEPAGKQESSAETNKNQDTAGKLSPLDEAVRKASETPADDVNENAGEHESTEVVPPHEELLPLIGPDWVRLHPRHQVWLDMNNKQVVVAGRVCFRDGPLEMFACPERTKEHESVISSHSNAEIIHTGLLATGAVPGKPVSWDPEFVAPSGPVVKITAVWSEDGKRVERSAQSMIIDARTGKSMEYSFVYCGSKVWSDPDFPQYREFQADAGDLVCVSNFSSALIDVGTESSQSTGGLMFQANPEMIPVLGKPVLLFLKPELQSGPGESKTPARADSGDPVGDANKKD
jgi:hypothetical protein